MARNEINGGSRRTNRLRILGLVGLLGLIVLGLAAWWFLFRDTSAASVNSAEGEEARAAAIASTQSDSDGEVAVDDDADANANDEGAAPIDEGNTEVDVGQPDSAASVGNETDGTWTVDTSIGTFDESCLTEACGATFAGFRINEELVSIGAKTVVGRTPGVSGSMEIQGSRVTAASFVVDMTGLLTDSSGRTSALRGANGGLETDTFPEAIFVLTEPIELGSVPVEGASVQVEATGDLTVHGVTRQVTIPLTAELQAGLVVVFGQLEGMLLSDYDIPTPTALVVVSVEDNATMELQLFLSR